MFMSFCIILCFSDKLNNSNILFEICASVLKKSYKNSYSSINLFDKVKFHEYHLFEKVVSCNLD